MSRHLQALLGVAEALVHEIVPIALPFRLPFVAAAAAVPLESLQWKPALVCSPLQARGPVMESKLAHTVKLTTAR